MVAPLFSLVAVGWQEVLSEAAGGAPGSRVITSSRDVRRPEKILIAKLSYTELRVKLSK